GSRGRRAQSREAVEVRGREQRALGYRFHLVRLAAGPDPGVPHVPDLRGTARGTRLSRDYAGSTRENLPGERGARAFAERRGSEEINAARCDCARAGRVQRERAAAVSDLRAENAPAVPEPSRLERRLARVEEIFPVDRNAKPAGTANSIGK